MKLTLSLIVLNVLIFAISLTNPDYYISIFGFSAKNFFSGNYYTAFSAMFFHAGLLHLGGNMLAIFLLGWGVEKKVKAWQYLLAYFLAGILGSLSLLIPVFGYSTDTIAIGASAAISGLVGFGIFMCPGRLVVFPSFLPLPFAVAGAFYLLATLSNLFAPGYVAHSAHLFGFLTGAVLGLVWGENRIKRLMIFVALLILIVFLPIILPMMTNLFV